MCRMRNICCDTGNHWVHYKCQKLTEEEIQIAGNSSGDEYYKASYVVK
jgi:hypothetical protein